MQWFLGGQEHEQIETVFPAAGAIVSRNQNHPECGTPST